MALTLIRIGRYSGGAPESATGIISPAGASRASVYDPLSTNCWITKSGFIGGKVSANAVARMSVYEANASQNPATRLGYMATVNVTTIMVGGGDGTHYTALVELSDNGPSNVAIMGFSGKRLAIDLIAGTATMRHSMVVSPAHDNNQFYNRSAPSNPPPSSYGSYTASVEGACTFYLEAWANVAPFAPSAGLYPTGTITETTPTITADFKDNNGSWGTTGGGGVDTGDQISQYRIQARVLGSSTLIWDTQYNATAGEKAADAVSRAWGGSSLTRGVTYQWRMKYSDAFGAWSDYSAWTNFTPATLGFVTLDADPTGTIQSNQPDFKGRWNHQTAADMTRAQVRIRSSTGVILQTGADYNIADVASSALPGTLFTIPWASAGLTTLPWGANLRYEIRGKDASTWSDWSAQRVFRTNAAPTVPSLSSPADASILTAFPLLTFSMSDTDDTTATGLTGVIRITRPDLTTVDVTPTFNATSGLWEYQTTVTELSAYGDYSWIATGYDGTLYSGESATLGAATWSSPHTFEYALGPVVTVTAPADLATIASATLTVTWTAADQVKYQVVLYADGTATIVYDSGLLTSAVQSHEIPSGYLRNATSYDLLVSVTDSTPLVGSSTVVNIDIAFTPANPIANFQVQPVSIGLDPWDTAIRLTWDQTTYSSPEWQSYTITRHADGGPDADQVILARITDPTQIEFVDYTPASGYEYTYGLTQTITVGLDTLESEVVEGVATVTLLGVVLTLLGNGETYRANLLRVRERSFDRQLQEAIYLIGEKPVTVRGEPRYWMGDYEGVLVTDTAATARQRWDELEALDAENGTVCIRDGWQAKAFVKLVNLHKTDDLAGFIGFTFQTREENASEGE